LEIAMAWPQPTDYNEALQNPLACFWDAELRHGEVEADALGLPRPRSGNFADVYRVHCPTTGNTWAVKCFTREAGGLRERYQAIHTHLQKVCLPFMVDFQYLERGIQVHGQWHALLKMRWIEGLTLNEFVRQHVDKPALLLNLAQMWVKLAQQLRKAGIAHGDLQHGNVLLVPADKSQALSLRLIDYDGMYVPALADRSPGERGHANYQHPERIRDGAYHAGVDRFSHLVIHTALRCLALAGSALWERHDNGENLLFREDDFLDPSGSLLICELIATGDAPTEELVHHLVQASQGPLEAVGLLEDLAAEENGRAVSLHGAIRPREPGPEPAFGMAAVPGSGASAKRVRPHGACASCGVTAHWFNAACPNCGRINGRPVVIFAPMLLAAGFCLVAARGEWCTPLGLLAGLAGLVGLPLALGRMVESRTAPGAVGGLLFRAGLQPVRSPTCRRCKQTRDAGWLACRHCSCIDLGAVVALGSFSLLCLGAAVLENISAPAAGVAEAMVPGAGRVCLLLGILTLLVLLAAVLEVARTQSRLRRRVGRIADLPGAETAVVTTLFVVGVTLVAINLTLARPQASPPPTPFAQQAKTLLPSDDQTVLRMPLVPAAKTPPDPSPIIDRQPTGTPAPGSFLGHTGPVTCVAFSADGETALSGSADRTVRLWRVRRCEQIRVLEGHRDLVRSVALAADGKRGLSFSHDHTVRVWDVASGVELRRCEWRADEVTVAAFAPDGTTAALGRRDGTIVVWDTARGTQIGKLESHLRAVSCLAFSADGNRLASGSDDQTIRVWDVSKSRAVHILAGLGGAVRTLALGTTGDRIACCCDNQPVRIWEVVTGHELARLETDNDAVTSVAFSPDASRLLSGGDDRSVRLWNAENGKEIARLGDHATWVNQVVFSPDGRHAFSAGNDWIMRLWDVGQAN
jgi:hypothetical protein